MSIDDTPTFILDSVVQVTDEVQKIDLTGVTAAKTWTVTFDGATTASIKAKAEATAAEVQAKLEALPNIDPGDVAVTGSTGGPFSVKFQGQYEGVDVPQVTVTAQEGTATVTTVTAGDPGVIRGTGNADATTRVSPLTEDSPAEARAANGSEYGDS